MGDRTGSSSKIDHAFPRTILPNHFIRFKPFVQVQQQNLYISRLQSASSHIADGERIA